MSHFECLTWPECAILTHITNETIVLNRSLNLMSVTGNTSPPNPFNRGEGATFRCGTA